MEKLSQKRIFLVLFFIFLSGGVNSSSVAGTFYGDVKTGLIQLEDYKYPVFLYVPEGIQPGRKYPLMISVPDEGEEAEDHIKKWMSLTQVKTVIILVPTFLKPEDTPEAYNRWIFQIKSLVSSAYPVNKNEVYLVGQKGATPYAAYLGINFPEEFSAVALLEGSWMGPFEKIMKFEKSAAKQVPFYIVLKADQSELLSETKSRAGEFESNGYSVELETLPDGEDFFKRAFNKRLFEWFSEKGEDWRLKADEEQVGFKARVRKGVKDFFTV